MGLNFTGSPAIVLDNELGDGEYFKSGVGVGDPFSWATWVQVSGSSTYNDLMDFNIEYVFLRIDDSGQVVYSPCYGDEHIVAVDCRSSLHHLAVVSDGSMVTIYFDNEEVDIYAITEECYCDYLAWFTSIEIGSSYRPSGESVVDELGLWTVALTPVQIAYLYNSGVGRTLYP
jgi:hypothetical protein